MQLRYRMWHLLLLTTLACCVLAYMAVPYWRNVRERELLSRFTKLGGAITRNESGEISILLGAACPAITRRVIPSPYSRSVTNSDLRTFSSKAWQSLPIIALSLNATQITDKGIVELHPLSQLRTLSLAGTNVTDDSFSILESFMGLKLIDISNTKISSSGADVFRRKRPDVQIVGPD